MSASVSVTSMGKRSGALFDLEALESLPCGCVAGAYRVRPWDVAVVSVEAKGPYCILPGHEQGQILRLGELADLESETFEDEEGTTYTL